MTLKEVRMGCDCCDFGGQQMGETVCPCPCHGPDTFTLETMPTPEEVKREKRGSCPHRNSG